MHGVMMQLWYVHFMLIPYFHCANRVQLVKDKPREQMVPGNVTSQVYSGLASVCQHSEAASTVTQAVCKQSMA